MPEPIQSFDFSVLNWIQDNIRCDVLDFIVPKITALGNAGVLWIVVTLLCVAVRKWRKCGITMAAALLTGLLVGNVCIKLLVARDRPCWIDPPELMLIAIPRDYSFPSCHTLSSFAASVSMLCYTKRAGIPLVVLAAMIALTRLYLYVHFPSDVLVGFMLGTGIAVAAFLLTKRYLWDALDKRFPELLV
jgi:undecaprenyl-diphosphatase